MMETFSLEYWIYDDDVENILSIRISGINTVGALKQVILEGQEICQVLRCACGRSRAPLHPQS
jgi:hypothetical protein